MIGDMSGLDAGGNALYDAGNTTRWVIWVTLIYLCGVQTVGDGISRDPEFKGSPSSGGPFSLSGYACRFLRGDPFFSSGSADAPAATNFERLGPFTTSGHVVEKPAADSVGRAEVVYGLGFNGLAPIAGYKKSPPRLLRVEAGFRFCATRMSAIRQHIVNKQRGITVAQFAQRVAFFRVELANQNNRLWCRSLTMTWHVALR
jgi:hypothetical protein